MLDTSALLYAKQSDRNRGKGGLPINGNMVTSTGVPYQLASGSDPKTAYDGRDCIRLTGEKPAQTMDLQTIGAYEKIYVLATAGGPGTGKYANFKVTLTYTDGSSDETTYRLYDWYDNTPVLDVEQVSQIWRIQVKTWVGEPPYLESYQESDDIPIMHSATIAADSSKLLKSVGFTMTGKGATDTGVIDPDMSDLYCGIFAVTGEVSANAPERPIAKAATEINSDTESSRFTANWSAVAGATGYRLDVSELENFTTLVPGYNNKLIDGGDSTSHTVTGLKGNTTYYYRLRAVNDSGQSLGSNLIATGLPTWIKKAGLSSENAEYDMETGILKLIEGVTLTNPLVLPNDSKIILDLNGKLLKPPTNQPAIQAPDGEVVELILKDSTSTPGSAPVLLGGNGQPAIDFSKAAEGSKVTLSKNTAVQGGNGIGNLSGGDGILGSSNTTITVDEGATATGGKGGQHGGNGGNGVTGGVVILDGDATGGKGGIGDGVIPAGTGGIGANSSQISGSGSATGGDGGDCGDSSTAGKGGASVQPGAPAGNVTVKPGGDGAIVELGVTITGLSSPTKTYNGTAVADADFGTVTATVDDNLYTGTLTYTYYKAGAGGALGELLAAAPKDAGRYILMVSTPVSDTHNLGQAAISFTIGKAPCVKMASAPSSTPDAKSANSITLAVVAVEGETVQYAKSITNTAPATDADWQDETVFNGLSAGTDYYFFARVKETDNYNAGTPSTGTKIKTDKRDDDKLAEAKSKAEVALAAMTATNDTTADDVMTAVNHALSGTGVTAAWKTDSDFEKTLATEDASGLITGVIELTLNGKKSDVTVNLPIAKLIADKTALTNAITTANNTKSGITMSDSAASSVTSGTKFVTTAEMKALTDAIAVAQTVANKPNATEAEITAAVTALNNAITTFKTAMKIGTHSSGSGGGGSSGGGSTPPVVVPPSTTQPNPPTTVEAKVPATVDKNGNATVNVTDKIMQDAIDKAVTVAKKNGTSSNGISVVINVTTGGKGANTVTVNLPKTVQEKVIAGNVVNTVVVVDRPDIAINMNLATITEINKQAKADVQLSATRLDNSKLSAEAKTAIGSRPTFDLKASYAGGTKEVTSVGTGTVTIEIPYALQKGEIAGGLYAVYLDGNGKVSYITNSSYDANTKVLRFATNHFGVYGIGYKAPTDFTDIANHWAKDDIEYVVNRGLFSGTSTSTFSPNGAMTRGMFVTTLGRLAGADVSSYKASSFSDVKADTYYMGYIEWASKNGIVKGIGEGKFAPDQSITREQMAVIIESYANAIGYTLPTVHAENTFADSNKIGTWAKDSVKKVQIAGIISGKSGNVFDPQGTATRAEVSAVLHRFIELIITNDTAQGWMVNDSGK